MHLIGVIRSALERSYGDVMEECYGAEECLIPFFFSVAVYLALLRRLFAG